MAESAGNSSSSSSSSSKREPVVPLGYFSGRQGIGGPSGVQEKCDLLPEGAPVDPECVEGKEVGVSQLLTEYGLIAIMFHFSIWVSCVAVVFSALSAGFDISALTTFFSIDAPAVPEADDTAQALGETAKAATTLGLVEITSPARLALTVAATPRISPFARRFAVVRQAEAMANRMVERAGAALDKIGVKKW
jgi:hypothetical protein